MSERKKLLWLVSWYPNKFDPFDGDFIQRHAKAAALYDDIIVLFVKQAEEQSIFEIEEHRHTGLTERLIYLPKKSGWWGRLSSAFRWQKVFREEAALLIKNEKPTVVHVHVPWKAGLIALWLERRFGLPFFVTEHWGIYNRVVDDHIGTRSLLFWRLLKRVYQNATTVVSVSRYLGEGINRTLLRKSYTVVANVVDTTLFFPAAEKAGRFTFLHVSNMVPLKNVEGILQAFLQFIEKDGFDAQLILLGNRDDRYVQLARQMNLPDRSVYFRGEVPYHEVASEMRQAHVLVLNSDMENAPCVIGEALCCGLPVIATSVGGIPELVLPENSILIPPRDTEALTDAFGEMVKNYNRFDVGQIAASAREVFSMEAVGRKLHELHRG